MADREGEDHGRRALVLDRGFEGGIDLCGVVTTEAEATQLLIRQMGDPLGELGVFAKEVLADICAG